MKRNGIVLLMSALMLLTAAVYITGCSQPASNSSQNQGNQNNQSGNQSGNQGNQGGGINQGGNQGNQSNQTGIEGVWEVKKYGSTTYPVMQNGVESRLYYSIKNGKLIMAEKKGTTLQKIEELPYTLSGNTITLTMPNGEPPEKATYSINGSSLKITGSEGLIECMRVTSPTAQEIESAQ